MLELIRKNTLLTEQFAIETDTNVDSALSVVSINTVDGNEADGFKENTGITLSLDYDELDEIIIILQQASESLKRAENRD
ncbi:hypothetical protein FCT18_14550 [Lysinibacillus sphaericus]|uniref:Uncharacterized protein n=1 Tax=Lysinibacillus sphaericus TaxID=1421 RepID=A0A2S0K6J1_LYSSH|nr:hypothetical protein [Lysinibacillus sphaericus]AVK98884.1 hypothetical protein LS41612_22620 [Lysinibacillus sphaericus]MED4545253.1 hypothetical protein [Lysinibacillus sphaericus]TKI18315.1 hypothetical protein FCT18_14550 [Lysinibacillus sphaericus]SUV15097.1 Uncharacterised protein [Lysinibacillus sphaericus]GEC82242.1 hypothetical protein LSP03_19850 [Lysinibacillus sphaericus]